MNHKFLISQVKHLLGYTTSVSTFEVSLLLAHWTILGQLVSSISAIIFSITEEPLGNAAVVCMTGASLPSCSAVSVPADVRRLVTVVTAIVVEIAAPQDWNTFAVVAREFSFGVALAII